MKLRASLLITSLLIGSSLIQIPQPAVADPVFAICGINGDQVSSGGVKVQILKCKRASIKTFQVQAPVDAQYKINGVEYKQKKGIEIHNIGADNVYRLELNF